MRAIRLAVPADLNTVIEILHSVADWLHAQGYDQWPKGSPSLGPDQLGAQIERGEMYLISDDGDPIATIAVSPHGDPDFWTPAELSEPAVYLSKAAVVRAHAGKGLGALILRWAIDHAAAHGKRWARLDVWRTNHDLHAYYRAQGWAYLRTVTLSQRNSGALFQRPARPDLQARAAFTEQEPPTATHDDLMRLYSRTWLSPGTAVIATSPSGLKAATIIEVIGPDYSHGEIEGRGEHGSGRPPVMYEVKDHGGSTWTAAEACVWPDPCAIPVR